MNSIVLRGYQDSFYNGIIGAMVAYKHVCAELATGGGKSIVIGHLANNLKGRTLVLTHRVEILEQNSKWLHKVGVLTRDDNTLSYDTEIVIAMVQTLHARLEKYGMDYVGQFDNIILDEVHIDIFKKVFQRYDYKHLIGFTGTPVTNKKKYFSIEGTEYVQELTLAEDFDILVSGPTTQDLIGMGFLVQDFNIVLELPDFDKLKESNSNPDGYTIKSLNEVYSNTASLHILTKAYKEHCLGKKTIIYNASNKITMFVYKHFKKMGCNVKMYDSSGNADINPDTGNKYKREEIIEWFRNERDAILVNTNVFTTGFDVDDTECIIVNRATKSLAMWIQIVGRGSRTTLKIFKDKFTVIDLGQNINLHGIWSKVRDWQDYFKPRAPKTRNKMDMLSTWMCGYCEAINTVGELTCCICGEERWEEEKPDKTRKLKEGNLVILNEMPIPRATAILAYTMNIDKDAGFAFKLAENRIIDLFIHYNVTKAFYNRNKSELRERVREIYLPIYWSISKSSLPGSKRKKIKAMVDKIIDNIEIKMKYNE